jgi:hypothetical protein
MTLSPEALREDISEIKAQLSEIQRTVSLIAVQDERIKHCEAALLQLLSRNDHCAATLIDVQKHQASCPRDQLKLIWTVLIPQGLAVIGLLLSALVQLFHGSSK